MGGSEDGEGKGTKVYEVTGMTDAGWVSTLILDEVMVEGEPLLGEDELTGVEIDDTEEDECDGSEEGGVDRDDDDTLEEDEGKGDEGKDEDDEGAAKECPAQRRMSKRKGRIGQCSAPRFRRRVGRAGVGRAGGGLECLLKDGRGG